MTQKENTSAMLAALAQTKRRKKQAMKNVDKHTTSVFANVRSAADLRRPYDESSEAGKNGKSNTCHCGPDALLHATPATVVASLMRAVRSGGVLHGGRPVQVAFGMTRRVDGSVEGLRMYTKADNGVIPATCDMVKADVQKFQQIAKAKSACTLLS